MAELTPETVALLRAQGARLARLAEDLAAVTKAESGELTLTPVPTDPAELLRLAHLAAQGRATAAGVDLRLEVAGSLPSVLADPDRMAQVLGNLVENALRHTPPGGRVTLSGACADDEVALAVTDTGEGIAPEHLPNLFERFYRAETARDRLSGGSGIGLAITKALVEAQHGRVRAHSRGRGTGARFVVTLPVLATGRADP